MEGLIAAFSQPPTIIGLSVILLIIIAIVVLRIMRKKQETASASTNIVPKPKAETGLEDSKKQEPGILGTGEYKCIAWRWPGNIIDFTTMKETIGEIYLAETSCPVSGGHYIVQETEDKKVIDYDPRKIPIIHEQTPEYAWFATHWEILKAVFYVPISWLKQSSTWFAAASTIVMFVIALIFFGG